MGEWSSTGSWQGAYYAALLEPNEQTLLQSVETARKAIQDRVAALNRDPGSTSRERKELYEALHYLSRILECSANQGGKMLWC